MILGVKMNGILEKQDNEKSNLKIVELREKMREYLTWLKPRQS